MVPEEAPLVVFDGKSAMRMANNGKDTKHTRHITRRIHLVRNGEGRIVQILEEVQEHILFSIKVGQLTIAHIFQYQLHNKVQKVIRI